MTNNFKKIIKLANKFEIKFKYAQMGIDLDLNSDVKIEKGAMEVVSNKLNEIQKEGEIALKEKLNDETAYNLLIANRVARDGEEAHMTVINSKELSTIVKEIKERNKEENKYNGTTKEIESAIKKDILHKAKQNFDSNLENKGLGKASKDNSEAYFMVISWDAGNNIRKEFGLDPKDFHITVGFNPSDVHGMSKGISSLI